MKDKDYTLDTLSAWVEEALSSGYSSNQVYDTIIESVKKNMKYHKACYDDSVRLLALLRGNTNTDIKVHSNESKYEEWMNFEFPSSSSGKGVDYTEKDYWDGKLDGKEFQEALEKYGYEYTPGVDTTKFKLDSPDLHNDDEDD